MKKLFLFSLILIGIGIAVRVNAANDTYSSYHTTTVNTSAGDFSVRMVSIDLGHPRLQIKTLSTVSGERFNQAGPVQPLKTFVDTVGGFAAINGCYFCPADYPSCSGIAGSFYWMWYDSLSGLFVNAYQNQFNRGPVIAFDSNNQIHYYRSARDWPGKDLFEQYNKTRLQAAFSNGPELVFDGRMVVDPGDLDAKQRTVKSNRSGFGYKNNTISLVVATQATVLDLANIMQALGMQWAVNLDGGGSSALYYDGQYRLGPGRNIPTALVFIEQAVSPVVAGTNFFAYDAGLRGGFYPDSGNVMGDETSEIITGTGSGLGPQVRIFDQRGNVLSQFFAYDKNLRNGVTLSSCDINADGYEEIITAPGPGSLPLVRIFDSSGKRLNEFFVLDGKFTGGVNLSCGDTDGNGVPEIVVAAMKGGGPQVLVYDQSGRALTNFMAYDREFHGGVSIATIDMDGDGRDEIVTGPQFGAPQIEIFQIRPGSVKKLSPGFYSFNPAYRGGVSLAGVDIDGNGTKELLVGAGENAQPFVKVYDIQGRLMNQFYAFNLSFQGGVRVAGGDVDHDGDEEIIVTPRSNGSPTVRVIEGNDI